MGFWAGFWYNKDIDAKNYGMCF